MYEGNSCNILILAIQRTIPPNNTHRFEFAHCFLCTSVVTEQILVQAWNEYTQLYKHSHSVVLSSDKPNLVLTCATMTCQQKFYR